MIEEPATSNAGRLPKNPMVYSGIRCEHFTLFRGRLYQRLEPPALLRRQAVFSGLRRKTLHTGKLNQVNGSSLEEKRLNQCWSNW